jgi:hypothetical protein
LSKCAPIRCSPARLASSRSGSARHWPYAPSCHRSPPSGTPRSARLNRVIHVWPYKDFEERTRVRAESQKLQGWPPNTREFVVEQKSEVFLPAPFSPKLEPRQLGGLYEIRLYTLKPGGIPGVIDRWSTAITDRVKLSPLAFAGHSEFGGLNRWCHIWAYKDAAERFAVREKARKEGIWPPKGGQPGQTLVQEKLLVVPAAFSPLH